MNEQLPVTVIHDDVEEVPIKLDAATLARHRRAERLAEAEIMQRVGAKVLKVKTQVLGKIGKEIEKLGVKDMGYGYLASANDNAGTALVRCDEFIADLMAKTPEIDPEVIVEIMRLKLQFNAQIIEVGESHLKASREAGSGTGGNSLQIPFPAGQSMTVSVAPTKGAPIADGKSTT